MKRKIYSLFLALLMLVVSACDLNLLDDPNAVTRDTASTTFLLNRVQLNFVQLFNTAGDSGMRLTRMLTQGNNLYEQAYLPVSFNGFWSNAYANILNDVKLIEELATTANQRRHLGMARVIRAYTLMLLVDYFGDVPFREALNPANFSPVVDPGAAVYQAAFADLNAAREDFTAQSLGTPTDFFYANNYTRWGKLVNTLLLKYHLNRKLVDRAGSIAAINSLISGGQLLAAGEDFVFTYGTSLNDPDSRHPRFAGTYTAGGGDYQATWYMWHLTEAKGFDDPRVRYYMYRQRLVNTTNPDELRCIAEFAPPHYQVGGWPFCIPGQRGYWGRDHLNAEGIPPDNLARTVWGLYPAGGRFDNNSAQPVNNPQLGNRGAGIQPIMLAAFADFMLAEASATLGTTGDAKQYLLSGIQKHMNYVRAYALGTAEAAAINAFQTTAQWNTSVTNYTNFVSAQYDAAPNKMQVIGREYWLSLYGNGVEAYNLYRRTGQPDNMQPGLLANFGDFPRSFLYPNNFISTNSNASQKANMKLRVFWDTNPEGFIY